MSLKAEVEKERRAIEKQIDDLDKKHDSRVTQLRKELSVINRILKRMEPWAMMEPEEKSKDSMLSAKELKTMEIKVSELKGYLEFASVHLESAKKQLEAIFASLNEIERLRKTMERWFSLPANTSEEVDEYDDEDDDSFWKDEDDQEITVTHTHTHT